MSQGIDPPQKARTHTTRLRSGHWINGVTSRAPNPKGNNLSADDATCNHASLSFGKTSQRAGRFQGVFRLDVCCSVRACRLIVQPRCTHASVLNLKRPRLVKILDLLENARRRIKIPCWKQKPNEFDAIA